MKLEELKSMGRAMEIKQLESLLTSPFYEISLCIFGPICSGKTEVIKSLILELNLATIYIDEMDFLLNSATNTPESIFVLIFKRLHELLLLPEFDFSTSLTHVPILFQQLIQPEQSFTIVLDDANRYLSAPALNLLVNLSQKSKRKLRIVFLSREPISLATKQIEFRPYSQPQVLEQFLFHYPQPTSSVLIRHISTTFPFQTLHEITTTHRYFVEYTEEAGERADLQRFDHTRVLEFDLKQGQHFPRSFETTKHLLAEKKIPQALPLVPQLPRFAKLLLLACFLCTNNPPLQDLLLFGTKKRRSKKKNVEEDVDLDLSFGWPRVEYVFDGLKQDVLGGDKSVRTLVPCMFCLCDKGLVEELTSQRFRCLATEALVAQVALQDFALDLTMFLYKARVVI